MNPDERDDAFLRELVGKIPPAMQNLQPGGATAPTQKCISLSKGVLPLSQEEETRLLEIASRRGKVAKQMLEEIIAAER